MQPYFWTCFFQHSFGPWNGSHQISEKESLSNILPKGRVLLEASRILLLERCWWHCEGGLPFPLLPPTMPNLPCSFRWPSDSPHYHSRHWHVFDQTVILLKRTVRSQLAFGYMSQLLQPRWLYNYYCQLGATSHTVQVRAVFSILLLEACWWHCEGGFPFPLLPPSISYANGNVCRERGRVGGIWSSENSSSAGASSRVWKSGNFEIGGHGNPRHVLSKVIPNIQEKTNSQDPNPFCSY